MSDIRGLAFVLLFGAVAACGKDDPFTAVDRAKDCNEICDRYRDCFSASYDVDECTDRCTDMVSKSDTADIDECESCLDDTSCSSSLGCTAECAGIVIQ